MDVSLQPDLPNGTYVVSWRALSADSHPVSGGFVFVVGDATLNRFFAFHVVAIPLVLLGLVVGAIATVMALRAIDARKDHFPEAVMQVQGWHMGRLKAGLDANRCATTDALPHLQALRTLANDLEPAFPGLAEDERFAGHASQFRATLDAALASPPADCAALGQVLGDAGAGCKACHQDFRG